MDGALPIAMIGSGAIAEAYYFPILSADPKLKANTWIVEPSIERGRAAAKKFGFDTNKVAARIDDLPTTIKTAINATPSHIHLATTMPLIERGVSVIVEKPFAEIASDARAMLAAAEGKSILTANHFRRLAPSYALVHDYIRSGKLGTITRVHWEEGHKFDWPTQSGFNFRRPWPNGRPRGALLDIGVHVFDIICWWLDAEPKVISAEMDGYGGPEAFVATKLTTDTAAIDVKISFLAKLANNFVVEGTKGSVRSATSDFARIEYKPAGGSWSKITAPGSAFQKDIARRLVMNFLEVVSTGKGKLLIDAASVVAPLATIDAIYEVAVDPLPLCYQEWVA